MMKVKTTLTVMGIYVLLTAFNFLFLPGLTLNLFSLPESAIWVPVVGVLALAISLFYLHAGYVNNIAFAQISVIERLVVFLGFGFFGLTVEGAGSLIIFGAIDLVGAIWTFMALRQEGYSLMSSPAG